MSCLHPINLTQTLQGKFKQIYNDFGNDSYVDTEIFYKQLESFKQYKNKTILLIGGGPSTNDIQWENIDVDYIWSINHFFLNNRIQNVSLATLAPEVNLVHPKLLDYLAQYSLQVGFEYNKLWTKPEFKFHILDLETRCLLFCMHTRFTSQLGGLPRLMILAHFLQVSKLYFVGLDGCEQMKAGNHAFTPGKVTLPVKVQPQNAPIIFDLQYEFFFKYFYQILKSATQLINLGENLEYNMPAKYTRTYHPLSSDLWKKIK